MPSTWRRSVLIEVAVDDMRTFWGEGEAMDAIPAAASTNSAAVNPVAISKMTMLVSTGSTETRLSSVSTSPICGPVVFVQSGQFVIQGVVAGRCQNTDLAHPSAENFARTVRFGDEGRSQSTPNQPARRAFGEAH